MDFLGKTEQENQNCSFQSGCLLLAKKKKAKSEKKKKAILGMESKSVPINRKYLDIVWCATALL